MKTFEEEVKAVVDEIQELVIKKNRDYGSKNIVNGIIEPELAIAIRLNDKLSRLVNLVRTGHSPANETLVDTANDIIGYGIVLRMVLDGTFETPLGAGHK